jgi:uncharacterized DUF497 family protein
MDVLHSFQGASFEWNANKAQSNFQKHGVTFEEAVEAFFDPFYQIGDASVEGEQREFIIGYTFSQQLLLVVFVERRNRTRIISARPATGAERKFYEEG